MEGLYTYTKQEVEAVMLGHHRKTKNPELGKQWQAVLADNGQCKVVLVDVKNGEKEGACPGK